MSPDFKSGLFLTKMCDISTKADRGLIFYNKTNKILIDKFFVN